MSKLADKIRKSRETGVEVGGFTFTIRRPTDVELTEVYTDPTVQANVRQWGLLRFVVGWSNVREIDLVPGGDPHPLDFDADACTEWLRDRPDLANPLMAKVTELYAAYREKREDAKKN